MKKYTKFLFLLSFCCAGIFSAFGQTSRDDRFLSEFVVRNWGSSDGLPGNSITDIIQGSDAYLYIGGYDGLIRFDGVEFIVSNRNTNAEFDFASVRSLYEDSQNRLWIGANDEGISYIDMEGNHRTFSTENGLPNNSIRAICEDKNGIIWVGTASGIACIKDEEVVKLPGWDTIPNNNKFIVKHLYCDTAGRIWITTSDNSGSLIYADRAFSEYKSLKSFNSSKITYVTQDSSKNFWFGVAPYYAVRVNGKEETVYNLNFSEKTGTAVNCIYQDSFENIWFGMDSGLAVLHDNKLSYMNQYRGLAADEVTKIIEDRDGNIWLATDRGGVEKFSQTKFKTTAMSSPVNAIAQDVFRDVVWLAADDGLYCYDDGEFIENQITEYCKNERVRHVEITKKGDLLVSTYKKKGQLKFDLNGKVTTWSKENGKLTGNKTRIAIEASNGDIYIGTTNGLCIIDGKTEEPFFITSKSGIQNDYIMCIFEDDDHNIWVGTDGGGIFVLNDKKIIQTYDSSNGLAGNVIFKISSLKQGEIWICTGTGVNRYKDGKFFTFNYSNGLGIDSVFQMIVDYTMKVWCTSNRGIFAVKLEELEEVIEGRRKTVNSKYFGYSDGIISSGVTSTSLGMKDDIGQIWFTLSDGFAVYNPVKNSENNKPPVVHVQQIMVDNTAHSGTEKVFIVKSNEKRVSIKYTGISFVTSEQVQFKTKLDGFDKYYTDWHSGRMVSYTNLKPGTYTFHVLAQNSNEIVGEAEESIVIIKKPALWQTLWFWILFAAIIGCTVTGILRHKMNTMKAETEKVREISLEITQTLAGTIDAKDKYTKGHSSRVAKYSIMLASKLGKSQDYISNLYMCAILHDIGKIGIPDSIINKPRKLTAEEYSVIKTHPAIGSEILSSIKTLPDMGIGAHWHHERWDGKGYPDGLKETEIPEVARIIAVADAYDAMTSNRSYRKYIRQEVVRNEIETCAGTQFDPEIAKKMLEIIDEDKEYVLHE